MSENVEESGPLKSGGQLLVEALRAQGADRCFCVPGESYLPVLDALIGSGIDTVVCRQEGGATMMAEADGKLTGRPGIAFVTRGPGATNAASGVHVAAHDLTPMILFVGQVPTRFRGRGAFQEVNYEGFYGGMAKAVFEARSAAELPGLVGRAYRTALDDAPGPVVVALPEDTLSAMAETEAPARVEAPPLVPSDDSVERLWTLLDAARRPVVVLGGSRWTPGAIADLSRFAESWDLPVVCSFRRQSLFPNDHPNYAGDLGLGANPSLVRRVAEADLVLSVGARLGEVASQSYTLFDVPEPRQTLVHVLPSSEELNRVYRCELAILADPASFARKSVRLQAPAGPVWSGETHAAHADYLAWSSPEPDGEAADGFVDPFAVMAILRDKLPRDAIMTNGAGNYAGWLHRFHRFGDLRTQLAPTSGSMGYGLPAGIAASLRHPERTVVTFAGDGCFQMTSQEFATAIQAKAKPLVILFDNGQYGTIRMHQEGRYPGRRSATTLRNPDFAALAQATGGFARRVERTEEFADALNAALASGQPALLHLTTDPNRISTTKRLSG